MDVVVGADVGGTSTRVGVATRDGDVVGVARGPGANPNAVGSAASARIVADTVGAALVDSGGGATVSAVVLGMAGGSRVLDDDGFAAEVAARTGVRPRVVSDLAVAFASATAQSRGHVLVAGTGAVAGEIDGAEVVRRHDGWGWLVGDDGSGFWLGRAAVRGTLRAADAGRPATGFHRAVLEHAASGTAAELLHACYAHPPIWLASFGALVAAWADEDPEAESIGTESARLLARGLLSLGPDGQRPVVVGGSVLASAGMIAERFLALVEAGGCTAVLRTGHGVVGALWTALRDGGPGAAGPPLLAGDQAVRHAALVASYGQRGV